MNPVLAPRVSAPSALPAGVLPADELLLRYLDPRRRWLPSPLGEPWAFAAVRFDPRAALHAVLRSHEVLPRGLSEGARRDLADPTGQEALRKILGWPPFPSGEQLAVPGAAVLCSHAARGALLRGPSSRLLLPGSAFHDWSSSGTLVVIRTLGELIAEGATVGEVLALRHQLSALNPQTLVPLAFGLLRRDRASIQEILREAPELGDLEDRQGVPLWSWVSRAVPRPVP